MAGLRRKNSKQADLSPQSLVPMASSGSISVPTDNQTVADNVMQLLERASARAEVQIQHSQKIKATNTRRTARVLRDVETMISTEALLNIAKRRHDVGEVLCNHCSKSIRLADALPTGAALQMVPRTLLHRKGPLVIVPERSSAVQHSGASVQQTAGASVQLSIMAALPAQEDSESANDDNMLDEDIDGSVQDHPDNDMLDEDLEGSLQQHPDNELLDDEEASPTSPMMELCTNARQGIAGADTATIKPANRCRE
jgi:hypothetical protein